MLPNSLPLSYWTLAGQFLQLAHESCAEIVNAGNVHAVVSSTPVAPNQYAQLVRWSDHSVGTAVLFSFFHGIELTLKGFLAIGSAQKSHHRLTDLLADFEQTFPNTDLGRTVASSLPGPGTASPLGRFLASNTIQIDNWYEALKYPESTKGQVFSHFDLKFGGTNTLPFWQEIYALSAQINVDARALSKAHGY